MDKQRLADWHRWIFFSVPAARYTVPDFQLCDLSPPCSFFCFAEAALSTFHSRETSSLFLIQYHAFGIHAFFFLPTRNVFPSNRSLHLDRTVGFLHRCQIYKVCLDGDVGTQLCLVVYDMPSSVSAMHLVLNVLLS